MSPDPMGIVDPILRELQSKGIRTGFRVCNEEIACTLYFDACMESVTGRGQTVMSSLRNAERVAGYFLGKYGLIEQWRRTGLSVARANIPPPCREPSTTV